MRDWKLGRTETRSLCPDSREDPECFGFGRRCSQLLKSLEEEREPPRRGSRLTLAEGNDLVAAEEQPELV